MAAKAADQKTILNLDTTKLEKAADTMRALAHPLRMKIIAFIDKSKNVHVNKIYNSLGLEQSITSQHLRILRNADLVKTKREGKFVFYSLNYDRIAKVLQMTEKYDM